MKTSPTFAEFFAGIGLVRQALERQGFSTSFANDIEPVKFGLYAANFGTEGFALCDVRTLSGDDIPTVDLASASFRAPTYLLLVGAVDLQVSNPVSYGNSQGLSERWANAGRPF